MQKQLIAIALGVVLAGLAAGAVPTAFADDPSGDDQAFFTALEDEGLHPDYDQMICGTLKCEPLRELLVQEGHAVCSALSKAPRLVPISVVANLEVSPEEAHAVINAARRAYCPQLPDPYTSTS
ncbi:DUF732 domain-containing protein [Mycolicibacter kumamotonensis]|jgi:hypothetical protein|uniref:DUF732 domain-containing protein n=1 Tax=Mycolicibacter kumamotonensis TaxID=354243 RepID=A0A1B8SCQ4_9MYCO|nr:DUF732 domain-containing protein [Mycolicibacter kumamotonensis]OBY30510.1 hypothetical protein ACT18_17385 [Mycolicibacter kumamotonensis]